MHRISWSRFTLASLEVLTMMLEAETTYTMEVDASSEIIKCPLALFWRWKEYQYFANDPEISNGNSALDVKPQSTGLMSCGLGDFCLLVSAFLPSTGLTSDLSDLFSPPSLRSSSSGLRTGLDFFRADCFRG